ncbi:MAG: cereblon family protein [Rhodospirillales bacterium]|nr:cereblon family protein [Rhodospirillales bacterium]
MEEKKKERFFCARCHRLITEGPERLSMNGAHEHTVFNPAGIIFEIQCFRDAPGVASIGEASGEFTWFKNYVWRLALCLGCQWHLGWQFRGAEALPVFYGLIANRLSCEEDGDGKG